jgi:hypothetical protein
MAPPNEPPADDDAPAPTATPFSGILAADFSALRTDLDKKTADLLATLRQEQANRGGKVRGNITLSLDVKLDHRGTVEIGIAATVKKPEPERIKTTFHLLPDNGLSVNNPKQLGLALGAPREVPADVTPMRIVNDR